MGIVDLVAGAFVVAGVLRVGMIVWPPPRPKMDDPAALGMPMAGFASVRDAHAALTRQGAGARPKFKT
jgi:hypothetical protein